MSENKGGSQYRLVLGDCLEKLKELPDCSVDAVVTDPPAGIAFMGKDWDTDKGGRREWIAWLASVMSECLRILKPGGHAFVWALPRTSHWTATALEDAGFEVRDCVVHLFGSGFPKSHSVSRALDKLAVTDAAKWEGFGTALKPASEHWWLCRKSLIGTVAQNVLEHGTGAINVDGCRVSGRWPPNVVFSHLPACEAETCAEGCAVAELDAQSGKSISREGLVGAGMGYQTGKGARVIRGHNDSGGASRFFPAFRYQAKASRSEREAGLEGLPAARGPVMNERCTNCGKGRLDGRREGPCCDSPLYGPAAPRGEVRNHHPTVKPVELMRWLVRLVTPPGGVVLDPFTGSGTTGVAAIREGFHFLGIEREAEYEKIARARISAEGAHDIES